MCFLAQANDPHFLFFGAEERESHILAYRCWRSCPRGGAMLSFLRRGLATSAVRALLLITAAAVRWTGAGATTLVAARFEGGVVVGADSRTSQGSFVANRLTDKITPVAPSIFLARSGSSAGASQKAASLCERW